jgi:hypothetical protein
MINDPLSRALKDAPEIRTGGARRDVASYRTDHVPPLGSVLDGLRKQLIEAMSLPFFDGGANIEVTPVIKRALSEAGAATIVARKREPQYEATVALDVRSDHAAYPAAADIGRYQVAAHAFLRCNDARGRSERQVEVTVDEIGGRLQLDVTRLRADMAAAIRSMGKVSADMS